MVLTTLLVLLVRPDNTSVIALITTVLIGLVALFRESSLLATLMGRMVGVMLIFFVVLNLFLYPTWLQYMAGRTAALALNTQAGPAKKTLLYLPGTGVGGGSFWSYEFYADGPTQYVRSDSALHLQLRHGPHLAFTTAAWANSLRSEGFGVRQLATFPYYHVSTLSYEFLDADTRAKTLEPCVLIEVSR